MAVVYPENIRRTFFSFSQKRTSFGLVARVVKGLVWFCFLRRLAYINFRRAPYPESRDCALNFNFLTSSTILMRKGDLEKAGRKKIEQGESGIVYGCT
jgi:hypothetical protein